MGALRQIYLIIPTLLAAIAFALLLITFLDQTIQSSTLLSSLHFLELNTTNLNIPTSSTEAAVVTAAITSSLADTYTIGLWNSCAAFSNGTTTCTTPVAAYAFDPLTTFGLSSSTSSTIEALLPSSWSSALSTYRAASKWLFAAYCAAIALAATTILTGLLACALSRASACCTALLAWLAALCAIAASATATALFTTVKGLVEAKLGTYGLTAALGTKLLVYSWIGSAFMLAAAVAWMFGCCCSGARRERKHGHDYAHGTSRGTDYEPLVGAYAGGHHKQASTGAGYAVPPMRQGQWPGQVKTAYEPVHGSERV